MNRRLKKRKPGENDRKPVPKTGDSNRLTLVAAILSTVALVVAVAFYMQAETGKPSIDSGKSPLKSAGNEPSPTKAAVPSRNPADGSPQAPAGEQRVNLPERPIVVETEVEQKALLATVDQAVAGFPEDAQVAYNAALTYAELLQTERAIELFERSLALDDTKSDVVVAYADVLLQVGKQQQAVDVLQACLNREKEAEIAVTAPLLTALGEAFSQLGELENAVAILGRGTQEFPESGELHLRLSQAQNQLQQFEAAKANASKAIELGRTERAAFIALSTAMVRLGERDEAMKLRQQMPSIEAEKTVSDDNRYQESFRKFSSHTYAQVALAYMKHDSLTSAEKLLGRALSLDPENSAGLAALGDLCHRSGRLADALKIYERLVKVQPDNLVNYHNCASLAISMGDAPLAQKTLLAATQKDESGYADLYLAKFLLSLGNYPDAAIHAETAVNRSEDVEAYLVWITALQSQGKTVYAMNALLRAREVAPNDPRLANIQL